MQLQWILSLEITEPQLETNAFNGLGVIEANISYVGDDTVCKRLP